MKTTFPKKELDILQKFQWNPYLRLFFFPSSFKDSGNISASEMKTEIIDIRNCCQLSNAKFNCFQVYKVSLAVIANETLECIS